MNQIASRSVGLVLLSLLIVPSASSQDLGNDALVTFTFAGLPDVGTPLPPASGGVPANCGGIAPLETECSATGNFPSGEGVFFINCESLTLTGTIDVSVTSATGSRTFTCEFVAGIRTAVANDQQTGEFFENQSYTLTGVADGVGDWEVSVFF